VAADTAIDRIRLAAQHCSAGATKALRLNACGSSTALVAAGPGVRRSQNSTIMVPMDSVEVIIDSIERYLLGPGDDETGWIRFVSNRLWFVLEEQAAQDDLLRWLNRTGALYASSAGESAPEVPYPALSLSKAVHQWLQRRNVPISSRQDAVKWLISHLGKANPIDLDVFVVLGLQVVVWSYLPGTREFQGLRVRSSLLPDSILKTLAESFRVPHKLGAVSWMTAEFIRRMQGSPPETPPAPVAIYDAALDLRGRVAGEDLILGDRSVIGFPVLSGEPPWEMEKIERHLSGFVFYSLPVPGLFDPLGGQDGQSVFGQVADKFRAGLAHAIESHLLDEFGQFNLTGHIEGEAGITQRPLLSLTNREDPTGFLAWILMEPRLHTEWTANLRISEAPFIENIWRLYDLISIFPSRWADSIMLHMQDYAELVEGASLAGGHMAYVPRHRNSSRSAVHRVGDYYPPELMSTLNAFVDGDWHDFHLLKLLTHIDSPCEQNVIRRQLDAAVNLYLSQDQPEGYPHADLVVPVVYSDGLNGPCAILFMRFSCDASLSPDGKPLLDSDLRLGRFRTLFRILANNKPILNESIGRLLHQLDTDLRQVAVDDSLFGRRVGIIKQMLDAQRLLLAWITASLTAALSAVLREAPDFSVVTHAYSYICQSSTDYVDGLKDIATAICDLAAELAVNRAQLPLITVVSCWPRTWRPVVEELVEGSAQDLAELFSKDPGLAQLLTHLLGVRHSPQTIAENATPRDFSHRMRLVCPRKLGLRREAHYAGERDQISADSDDYVLDFGLPASDAKIDFLEIEGMSESTTIRWQSPSPSESPTPKVVKLRWDYDPRKQRHVSFGAASFVPGTITQRIQNSMLTSAGLTPNPTLIPGETGGLDGFVIANSATFAARMEDLQRSLFGVSPDEPVPGKWRPLDLPPSEGSRRPCFLVLHEPSDRPLVNAFRNVSLGYLRGDYLALVREQNAARQRGLTDQRASIRHAYLTPVEQLADTIRLVRDSRLLDSAPSSKILTDLIEQCLSMVALAEAAVEFALYDPSRTPPVTVRGDELVVWIAKILAGFYSPLNPTVERIVILNQDGVCGKQITLIKPLLLHGVAKLAENAVRAARDAAGRVQVTILLEGTHLIIRIANSARNPDWGRIRDGLEAELLGVDAIERSLSRTAGITSGRPHLGLAEARFCFDKQGIRRVVRRAEQPLSVAIDLVIGGPV
jgi:hypothetical protein